MPEHPNPAPSDTPSYRAYLIGSDGHIERAVLVQASNDDQAITEARKLTHPREVELWDGARMLVRFRPASTV